MGLTFSGGLGVVSRLMVTVVTAEKTPKMAAKWRKSTLATMDGRVSAWPLPQSGGGLAKTSPIRTTPTTKLSIKLQNTPWEWKSSQYTTRAMCGARHY
jgi:hypothetical protein